MRIPTLNQRLKAKKRSQAMVVGLTWYSAKTWAQVKATVNYLPDTEAALIGSWVAVPYSV